MEVLNYRTMEILRGWWVCEVRLLQTLRYIQCLQLFCANIQHNSSKVRLTYKNSHVAHTISKGSAGQLGIFLNKGISLDSNLLKVTYECIDRVSRTCLLIKQQTFLFICCHLQFLPFFQSRREQCSYCFFHLLFCGSWLDWVSTSSVKTCVKAKLLSNYHLTVNQLFRQVKKPFTLNSFSQW